MGDLGHLGDRTDDEAAQHDVEQHQKHQIYSAHRTDENDQVVPNLLPRGAERHREDLSTDNFAFLPAEAVLVAIERDHRSRRPVRGRVTDQAIIRIDLQREGDGVLFAIRRRPIDGQLLDTRVGPELLDHLRFPVDRLVGQICRIQSRFLIREIGELIAKVVEGRLGRERWNRLGQKLEFGHIREQRPDFLGRVAPYRQRLRTKNGNLRMKLLARIVPGHPPENIR